MRVIVNMDVPAIEPALRFYEAALGLRLKRMLDDEVAELAGASAPIYLLATAEGSPAAKSSADARRYARHWTPVHMDFVVEDIAWARQRALDAGAVQESECVEWLGSKCITFSDPFGHGFCLIEFEGETYRDSR